MTWPATLAKYNPEKVNYFFLNLALTNPASQGLDCALVLTYCNSALLSFCTPWRPKVMFLPETPEQYSVSLQITTQSVELSINRQSKQPGDILLRGNTHIFGCTVCNNKNTCTDQVNSRERLVYFT